MRFTIIVSGDAPLKTAEELQDRLLELEREFVESGASLEECRLVLPGPHGFNPDVSTPHTIRSKRGTLGLEPVYVAPTPAVVVVEPRRVAKKTARK